VIEAVLLVVLLIGAVARLCVLMVEDKITEFFRNWVVTKFGKDHLLSFGVVCPWCWSIWFAFPMTFLTFPVSSLRDVWTNILTALAVSYTASRLADGI
jgi:hypothetical protein